MYIDFYFAAQGFEHLLIIMQNLKQDERSLFVPVGFCLFFDR
ncbi:hypothetical protein GCM10027175_42550 [Hymenobacter latericoloratus]